MKTHLTSSVFLLCLASCTTLPGEPSVPPDSAPVVAAKTTDLVHRIANQLALGTEESAASVMNSLEHLLPAWVDEQRNVRAGPLEKVLTQKVVVSYEKVAEMFSHGPHERQLVAAWALGFTRVPDNPLGIESRHEEALELLIQTAPRVSDDVLSNIMLALWKIADPATPLPLITEIVVDHHDAMVRANATLVLSTVLTQETAPFATDALLVALTDSEPRVRLHAARVAIDHPHEALTQRMVDRLLDEETPFVTAAMARALGTAGAVSSAPALIALLENPRAIIATNAHQALVKIFGFDEGLTAEDWERVLP
jgi:hypothetical protein